MAICNNCGEKYFADDSDAGTYLEFYCSDKCLDEAEEKELYPEMEEKNGS